MQEVQLQLLAALSHCTVCKQELACMPTLHRVDLALEEKPHLSTSLNLIG